MIIGAERMAMTRAKRLKSHSIVGDSEFPIMISDYFETTKEKIALGKKIKKLVSQMPLLRNTVENKMVSFRETGVLVTTNPADIFTIEYRKNFYFNVLEVDLVLTTGEPKDRELRGEYKSSGQSESGESYPSVYVEFTIEKSGNFTILDRKSKGGTLRTEEYKVVQGKLNRPVTKQAVDVIDEVKYVLGLYLEEH
ncbi:MAG: hypothetical protein M1268_01265 [Patescibacteria group bacterium]|nr:hypothetical protein [Patescibacteria group bacterium]